ncbi:N-acyl-D-amino-acid deacylase family protein [Rhodanobacter glycinis]|uniref:N-acyl-D-aspartate/D-glutamate deacylase n=1 Tax=Rhodanobacter glycinis TaxID=582702 RepID=A0A1I4F4P4_9GAMM|nr:N-acyl-D-glutamate amidohydrolase [Rhodanobacter glycinis]SFL11361.1 N-acyl-D-aspartate/D-glutamate deacylase [Rhodanobacter glycinis]
MPTPYDVLIRRGTVFDGTGAPPRIADIGVRDGHIVAISETPLAEADATKVMDANGLWVTPGFIDIHTHYDAELLLEPGLQESVRHGVTTCFVGSCSISMIYSDAEDASDIFTRVESIPREYVLPALREKKTWNDAASYVAHLQSLPLGPNIASYMGHSDLRVAAMGLGRSVDPKQVPTEAELQLMEKHLNEGIDHGLLGMSGMTNPWDKVDGDRYRSSALPSVYARWSEYRRLHKLLRRRGAILQSAPNLNNPINAVFYLFTSASLAVRRRLKTTLITLMDVKAKPKIDIVMGAVTRFFNACLGASFRWQALPQPFQVYADGIDFVIFEEFPAGEAALHLKREFDRQKLFASPDYRTKFKADYKKKWGGRVWHRDFGDAHVIDCPDKSLVGKTIRQIADERGEHEVDTFLDLVIDHGPRLRWSTLIGNHNPKRVAVNLNQPYAIMGFSDAGAHLRNMAFYNFGLALLQLTVQDAPVMTPEKAVWRLTGEIADWYDLHTGKLAPGAQADIVLLDPVALKRTRLDRYAEAPFEAMGGLQRVVNRNDGVIRCTLIRGQLAFENDTPSPLLGRQAMGRFLARRS